jgi:flagellar basal-body rod protein FlgB
MDFSDTPLLSMLRERMTWLHQRQDLLSQNVANSDTPGYVARDLKAPDFDALLKGTTSGSTMITTNSRHFSTSPRNTNFQDFASPDVESSPNGNAVALDAEMIKVSDNQAQFLAAANLYSKTMQMMKTAISTRG